MSTISLRRSLWLPLIIPSVIVAQGIDESSIPEPTDLSVIASGENATLTVIVGSENLIASDVASSEISAIEIKLPGEDNLRGVRIALTDGDKTDQVYLDSAQARRFQAELAGFQRLYEDGKSCEALYMCLSGVARCRPSQTVTQAVCPTYYVTPDGRQGIRMTTPLGSFDFTYAEPSVFVHAIVAALGRLEQHHVVE